MASAVYIAVTAPGLRALIALTYATRSLAMSPSVVLSGMCGWIPCPAAMAGIARLANAASGRTWRYHRCCNMGSSQKGDCIGVTGSEPELDNSRARWTAVGVMLLEQPPER